MTRRVNTVLSVLVSMVPLAMLAVTCLDVIGRRFDRPLPGAIEMIELLMGLLVFGALPLVTVDRGHVTVGLFDSLFSGRLRRVHDAVVSALSAGVVAVISWRLFIKAGEVAAFGDRSAYLGVPMGVLAYFMAAAAALTAIVLLTQMAASKGHAG